MNIQKIKKIVINNNITDEELEEIHKLVFREYSKTGKSSYLIVDEDE